MTEKIFIVTDLGPGDGGKGGVVHYLANHLHAHTVIKRGGAQGSHGVYTDEGEQFNFSQWGCATLEGIPTFLSEQMIIMPIGLFNESEALRHQFGLNDPFKLLEADPSCICATPYHKIMSQVSELLLKDNPRGTIGTGVGQAYRFHQKYPKLTIRAKDLVNHDEVSKKLEEQRGLVLKLLFKEPLPFDAILPEDEELFRENILLLMDENYIGYLTEQFFEIGKNLKFNSLSNVLKRDGTAVVECSHGVLTDAETGFKPHVSAIRTLPIFTEKMIKDAGFSGEIIHYGVRRAYEIRHGAGPMPTADDSKIVQFLPTAGSHKMANRWQGKVRVGEFDFNHFKHALDACKEVKMDGLCLTWFETIRPAEKTLVEKEEVFKNLRKNLLGITEVPLVMLSFGPKDSDKIFHTS